MLCRLSGGICNDRRGKQGCPMLNRNMSILFFLYAISWCVMALAFSATASIGLSLVENKNIALLPLITQVLGSVFITLPASKVMKQYGRRIGLAAGSLFGVIGALLCAYGVYIGNFWVLVAATPFIGMFTGFAEFIKYAASDIYDDGDKKSRAISIIVSSGIIAAFLGPWVASYSNSFFFHIKPYFGPYVSVFGFCLLSLILSLFLNMKNGEQDDQNRKPAMSFFLVIKNPHFVAGTLASAIAYLTMAAMMDAMPIAMLHHGFNFDHTTEVVQWHLLAMFAPSYLTGKLVNHLGAKPVIFIGIFVNFVGICFALTGTEYYNFWTSLFLIGLGWNLMFLAGISIIATISDDMRPAAEGASNAILVVCFAISAPIASIILFQLGWFFVSIYALILLSCALLAVLIAEKKSPMVLER